jgi:hypothetical protein
MPIPVNQVRDVIDRLAALRKYALSQENKDGFQRVLELIFFWLMERLGPIWHETKRTLSGSPAFHCFLKWFPTMAVEMLPLRRNPTSDEIELLMFPRPDIKGDPEEYRGRLHSPGCMLMWGMTIREALDRVVAKETGTGYELIAPLPVNPDTMTSPRGYEVALPFVVQLAGDLPANSTGVWVPVNQLSKLYSDDKIIRAQFENFLEGLMRWIHVNEDNLN